MPHSQGLSNNSYPEPNQPNSLNLKCAQSDSWLYQSVFLQQRFFHRIHGIAVIVICPSSILCSLQRWPLIVSIFIYVVQCNVGGLMNSGIRVLPTAILEGG